MKWVKRQAEIEYLRQKHGKVRPVLFPDLSVESGAAPCSNLFAVTTGKREPHAPVPGLMVGHPHKSSLMVMFPSELEWAGGKKP